MNLFNKYIDEILMNILKLKNKIQDETILSLLNEYESQKIEHGPLENTLLKLKNSIVKKYFTDMEKSPEIFIEVHAGVGGDDARELAEILFKSYVELLKNNKIQIIETGKETGCPGIGTGILKATIPFYELMGEHGIHRIVRVNKGKKQTSFVSVTLLPLIQKKTVQILDKDLSIKTCKSSGAGGQHVNKTESAVIVTHVPSGITVKCQSEKSQHTNKQIAIDIINSKLEQKLQIEHDRMKNVVNKLDISWGNHFRNYSLYAPKLIQDNRVNIKIMSHKQIDEILYKGKFEVFMTPYIFLHFLNIINK